MAVLPQRDVQHVTAGEMHAKQQVSKQIDAQAPGTGVMELLPGAVPADNTFSVWRWMLSGKDERNDQ